MCLLSVRRPHIDPFDHQVPINSTIRFHLKWWVDTIRFFQGMSIHPPDPNAFLFMDASHLGWGAHLELMSVLSWSLVGRPIPAPYQYSGNDSHSFSTEESHKIHTPHLGYDSTDNTTVVSYINKQGRTHSPNLYVEEWEILHWCLEYDIVIRVRHIPGKFNILADHLSRLYRPLKTEWALDQSVANSILQMLNNPSGDLFATGFNHKLPLYVSPVPDNHALAIDALSMNWNFLHANAFPPTILTEQFLLPLFGRNVHGSQRCYNY